MHAAGKRK